MKNPLSPSQKIILFIVSLFLVSLLIVGIAFVIKSLQERKTVIADSFNSSSSVGVSSESASSTNLPPELVTRTLSEETEEYSIYIEYPEAGIGEFDIAILDYVNQAADSVRTEAANTDVTGAAGQYSIDLEYTAHLVTTRYISIEFAGSDYFGGAHPNYSTKTFLFDLDLGEMLALGDLFTAGSDYLEAISTFSITELESRGVSDSSWIEQGAGPVELNFQFFYLTDTALVISFPPYQVAAYAVGTQKVEIPYAELAGILGVSLP